MRTITETVYYTPENGNYSLILSGLSLALGATGLPGANITGIAGLIYGLGASNCETKIEIYRHWYNVTETASGEYICYYCEFNAYTYAKTPGGTWTYLGQESGDFNSFDIY